MFSVHLLLPLWFGFQKNLCIISESTGFSFSSYVHNDYLMLFAVQNVMLID